MRLQIPLRGWKGGEVGSQLHPLACAVVLKHVEGVNDRARPVELNGWRARRTDLNARVVTPVPSAKS